MKNEKGYALVIVLLTIVFVTVVGLGLMTTTANSNRTTVHERQDQSLYYIAEAGINRVKSTIIEDLNAMVAQTTTKVNTLSQQHKTKENFMAEFQQLLNAKYCDGQRCNDHEYSNSILDFKKQNSKQPTALIKAKFNCPENDTKCSIVLSSKGFFVGEIHNYREVEQQLEVDKNNLALMTNNPSSNSSSTKINALDFLKDFAVFTTDSINFYDKAKIDGAVGSTRGTNHVYIEVDADKSEKNKDAKIQDVSQYAGIDLNQFLPPFPSYPENPINNSAVYNNNFCSIQPVTTLQYLPSKKDLNLENTVNYFVDHINTTADSIKITISKNSTHNLFVNHLTVVKDLDIKGDGTLNIYVRNTFSLNGSIKINFNDKAKINVFHIGDSLQIGTTDSALVDGNLSICNGHVALKKNLTVEGNYYHHKGSITTITVFEDGKEKSASLKVKGDFLMHEGTISLASTSDFQNIYLNKVNLTISSLVNIDRNIAINEGHVMVAGTVDIDGFFYLEKGQLEIGLPSLMESVWKNSYIKGVTYLGDANLVVNERVDLRNNVYIRNGNIHSTGRVDIDKNLYVQKGKIYGAGKVDYKQNLYYADVHDVILEMKSDLNNIKGILLLAPNAKVVMSDKVNFEGTIVSKQVEGTEEVKVKYGKIGSLNAYLENVTITISDNVSFTPINNFVSENALIEK